MIEINSVQINTQCHFSGDERVMSIDFQTMISLKLVWLINWWFYVTVNDISVIYVTAHRSASDIVASPVVQSSYGSTSRKLQHKLWLRIWKAEYILFQIKKCLPKSTPVESGYFWGKSCYFNEKSLKTGKSQIHNSFLLIHCDFIINQKLKVVSFN